MSVRQGERKTSNLKYVQDAQTLATHTVNMCNNPNRFPEPDLASHIKQEVLTILENVRYHLATYTYNQEDTATLKKYTAEALAHIDALYALLELAYNNPLYKIDAKSMEYWISLIVNLEESIKKLGSVSIC